MPTEAGRGRSREGVERPYPLPLSQRRLGHFCAPQLNLASRTSKRPSSIPMRPRACLSHTFAREQIEAAQKLLSQLQERISGEEASSALNWFRVDLILESSQTNGNTKFFALQILENAIKYRWKTLPAEQRNGIKSFVVNLVIARSSAEETYRGGGGQDRLFTSKLNVILVQIVKQEWPHNWPSFISDIVNASKTNETLCENNMIILKLLSEEARATSPPLHPSPIAPPRPAAAHASAPAPAHAPPPFVRESALCSVLSRRHRHRHIGRRVSPRAPCPPPFRLPLPACRSSTFRATR